MTQNPPVKVLFIVGADRSGTTLISRIFGALPGCVFGGELLNVWERGMLRDELCSCGRPFSGCEFWSKVLRRTLPSSGWRADAEKVASLSLGVRQCAGLGIGLTDALHDAAALEQYSASYGTLFRAIAEIGDRRIVVDSSKAPAQALLIQDHMDVQLQVVHVIRDSRGVAHSLGRVRERPEVLWKRELMRRQGPVDAAMFWVKLNLQCERLARRVPTIRLQYERFLRDPITESAPVLEALDIESGALRALIEHGAVRLEGEHSASGNPMRFRTGAVPLVADDEWKYTMRSRDIALVALLTAPLLLRYNYRLRPGRTGSTAE